MAIIPGQSSLKALEAAAAAVPLREAWSRCRRPAAVPAMAVRLLSRAMAIFKPVALDLRGSLHKALVAAAVPAARRED